MDAAAHSFADADGAPAPRVLVADDDLTIRTLMTEVLQANGFEVIPAADGHAATQALADGLPDVVLLDLEMPGLDGIQVCQRIRGLPGGRLVPVVMATGHDALDAIDRAYAAGATDFITKPVNWPLLIRRLHFVMRASRAMAELESANRYKNQFLHNMSHELRTPMSGVLGMTDLLLDSGVDATQRGYLETIQTSGQALLGIINDVLDYARLETTGVVIDPQPCDLDQCITEVCELLAPLAQAKGIEFTVDMEVGMPASLVLDGQRLRQVLTNLLGNAIKFTERGRVGLSLQLEPGRGGSAHLAAQVTDSGIGIGAADQQRIFEPFMQADGSTTRRFGGTGLGLAICQQMLSAMDSGLTVRSEPGEGSVFSFRLPVGLPAAGAWSAAAACVDLALVVAADPAVARSLAGTAAHLARQVTTDAAAGRPDLVLLAGREDLARLSGRLGDWQAAGTRTVLASLATEQADLARQLAGQGIAVLRRPLLRGRLRNALAEPDGRSAQQGPAVLPGRSDLRVLVAEDNPVNQRIIKAVLARGGLDCELVADGATAVRLHAERAWDLVLMDCLMPGMDGYEATRRMRANESDRAQRAVVVALTANVADADVQACFEAGMDAHLAKPLDRNALFSLVNRYWPA